MSLRTQILLSILGITFFAQSVFGFLAYRQITESRGDQLTIFLQYLSREVAERLTLPGDRYVTDIYLEELRQRFSTPESILIVQKNNKIEYIAGNNQNHIAEISDQMEAYTDSDKHGLIKMNGIEYYWAVSRLPDNNYQLIMLEPAGNEEATIASTLRLRLIIFGAIILWAAVWISLLLSSKISRQLDEKNEQLKHLALHDNLTGLPNRTLLSDRLGQTLLQSQRNNQPFALFLMDLDRFKEVNDTLGHQFGDELLKRFSSRLQKSIRNEDSIARLGGDEFAILLPQTNLEGAKTCVERILHSMEDPFCINDISTESKASVGIVLYPDHGDNTDILMQYADIAMYQAKKLQSGYAIYSPEQNTHSIRRLRLMNDLRDAVDQNKISVSYQPIISNSQHKIISVEALARWQHHELGNITPDEFIPMAEQMGIIRTLTLQVFEQALKDCQHWAQQNHHPGININISTYCLQDLSFPEKITSIIKNYNFDASLIELEITESALMHDLNRVSRILEQLNTIGLKLAIDDFGTGFSSLNYLKKLPVDTLKIDKTFILDMCSKPSDKAIVKTIIELGHNLNCKVIAEGVENSITLNKLALLKVDIMQGFFYSKPLPASGLGSFLAEYNNQGTSD